MYHVSNDKRAQQSAELLFQALGRLIEDHAFSSITITHLVTEANVGRTTFYRCFDTIDDILQYKCDAAFSNCGEFLLKSIILEKKYDPKDTFIKPFLEFWSTDYQIIEVLIKSNKKNIISKGFQNMINQFISKYPRIVDSIEYFDYFIEIRSAIAIAILTRWIQDNRNVFPDKLIEVFKEKILLDEFLYDLALKTYNSNPKV